MKLSIEDYNKIAEYDKDFSHAINENYFRIVNRNLLKDYAEIYKRMFNRDSKILNGCSRCILQDIKALAKVYFDDKKEMTDKINEIVDENNEEEQKSKKMSQYTYGDKKTEKKSTKTTNKKK